MIRAGGLLLAGAVACAGCKTASPSLGLSALLRIEGTQFVPGVMPEDQGGPTVAVASVPQTTVRPGEIDKRLQGALSSTATSAAVGLEGDPGFWIVQAGPPDVMVPGFPTFDTQLSFSAALQPGEHRLRIQAVDANGTFGAPYVITLQSQADVANAPLRFTLRWDTQADLDLRVVDPNGTEIWSRNPNSWQPPPIGQPSDAGDFLAGGILDFDSNASCVIDGRREENITWKQRAPSGRYLVRMDTASLCGQPAAHWTLEIRKDNEVALSKTGVTFETDTREPHDSGAGALVAELDYP
ncbi:MAG: hypothetical protein ACT4TC_11915 [Myxococcaceae bacterium]